MPEDCKRREGNPYFPEGAIWPVEKVFFWIRIQLCCSQLNSNERKERYCLGNSIESSLNKTLLLVFDFIWVYGFQLKVWWFEIGVLKHKTIYYPLGEIQSLQFIVINSL